MTLPEDLMNSLEKEFSLISRATLGEASADLTSRYRSKDRDKIQTFITSDSHRLSYLAVRMPATYAVVKRVLEECQKRDPNFSPNTLSDIGAGPGTATWAALAALPSITSCMLYEKDTGWLQLGKHLMQQSKQAILNKAVWNEMDLAKEIHLLTQDLIILSYVVGELPLEAMHSLIFKAWQSTHQMLVVIEPGTPHGFERIRAIRDQLIQLGAFIVAPCPHHDKCPMENGDWCHFVERLERSSLHVAIKEGTMGHEDEKFSYLAVSKAPSILPKARILRHPQHHSGHINFILCTDGGLEKKTISKRHKDLYKHARKLKWGDTLET